MNVEGIRQLSTMFVGWWFFVRNVIEQTTAIAFDGLQRNLVHIIGVDVAKLFSVCRNVCRQTSTLTVHPLC